MSGTRFARLRWIFVGPQGLRAGWSLLLFVAILFLLNRAAHLVFSHPHPQGGEPQTETLTAMIRGTAIASAMVFLGTWIMSLVERRPLGAFGFGGRCKARHALEGALWGLVALSTLALTLWATGHLAFDGRALGLGGSLKYGALNAVAFLFVAYFEESMMRGYVQFTLARGIGGFLAFLGVKSRAETLGFWVAALGLAILFGSGHASNPGESPFGLVSAGLAGFLLCVSLWYSGSLWWALGFHLTWDWAQTFLYGTANSGLVAEQHLLSTHPLGSPLLSGGTTGPEGSLFILPVLVVMAVIIRYTLGSSRKSTPSL